MIDDFLSRIRNMHRGDRLVLRPDFTRDGRYHKLQPATQKLATSRSSGIDVECPQLRQSMAIRDIPKR